MADGRETRLEKGVYMRSNGTLVIHVDTADQTKRNGISLMEVGGPRVLTITRGAFQRIHREHDEHARTLEEARRARKEARQGGDA
jgi:hypothetical protein